MDRQQYLFAAFIVAALALVLWGCAMRGSGRTAAGQNGKTDLQEVSIEAAMEAWRQQKAVFIDVRTLEEYRQGHVPGAVFLPLAELEARTAEIPRDQPVLLICRSGNRSGSANLLLQSKGIMNTASVRGGMLAWREAVE